jgi:hypothetical protein
VRVKYAHFPVLGLAGMSRSPRRKFPHARPIAAAATLAIASLLAGSALAGVGLRGANRGSVPSPVTSSGLETAPTGSPRPMNLSVVSLNSSLLVQWLPPPGTWSNGSVMYNVSIGVNWTGPFLGGHLTSNTSIGFGGLTDGVWYYLAVAARTDGNWSPPTPAVRGIPVGVPYPASHLTVAGRSASTMLLTWDVPTSTDGSAITNYTVFWGPGAAGPWSTASAGLSTHWTLTGLKSHTLYVAFVEAWNRAGPGHPSAEVSATTYGGHPKTALSDPAPFPWVTVGAIVAGIAILGLLVGLVVRQHRRLGKRAEATAARRPDGSPRVSSPVPRPSPGPENATGAGPTAGAPVGKSPDAPGTSTSNSPTSGPGS